MCSSLGGRAEEEVEGGGGEGGGGVGLGEEVRGGGPFQEGEGALV